MEDIQAFPGTLTPEMSKFQNASQVNGMTLRDYFAGQALSSCYKQVTDYCDRENSYPFDWMNGIANDAYRMADAMLSARKGTHDTN